MSLYRGRIGKRIRHRNGMVAAGGPLAAARIGHGASAPTGSSERDRIPPGARPGGAYDRYVARLAAEGRFSGVVLLAYQGRTVLSRSYGMADREKRIRNHEGVTFNLFWGSQPFLSVAGTLDLVPSPEGGLLVTVRLPGTP